MSDYIQRLDHAIEESVRKYIEPLNSFGLLFSGGLDSSLLAKMCMDIGKVPELFSVYMVRSSDEKHVKRAAESLGIELSERVISPGEIPDFVDKVSSSAQTKNPLDIAIGVPLYAGLELAADTGYAHVMVGQGADELFAGYHRYLKMSGQELMENLSKDIENINIRRDRKMAESLGITLICPYLESTVVELGLSIPVEWKIRNATRKHILRLVAEKRGLSEEIYGREKKAIQYSTGVDKIIRKALKYA